MSEVELLELRYFVSVAQIGSFSKASIRLGVTQPALSRQVRKLERELSVDLLYRHGRGVTLTRQGQQFYDTVMPMLAELEKSKEHLREQSLKHSGSVSLGLPPSLCNALGSRFVARFHRTFPSATLKLHELFSGQLLEWIDTARLDLAVLYNARESPSMLSSPLLVEDLFLIEARDGDDPGAGPVAIEALPRRNLVLPGMENGMRRIIETAMQRAQVVGARVPIEVNSVATLKALVEFEGYASILPFSAVHREVARGQLRARSIDSEDMKAVLTTATPLHQPVGRMTRELLGVLRAEVADCIARGILHGRMVGAAAGPPLHCDAHIPPPDAPGT